MLEVGTQKSWKNKLYFGDNLEIMKKLNDNSIDLIYLDPPFKSGRDYNIIFKSEIQGKDNKIINAQIRTFEDTWIWGNEAEKNFDEVIQNRQSGQKLVTFMKAMREYLGECSMMAYLAMMAPRLVEMRRILKDTGSIYLHCDPTSSHYLKLLMDAIFGSDNFLNEIVWCYEKPRSAARRFKRNHDVILFYSKSDSNGRVFNMQYVPRKGEKELKVRKPFVRKDGTVWYPKYAGKQCPDWWEDIPSYATAMTAKERVGYPTQKPEKLLERIILASSNKGDIVLDPFCGCGTAVVVAEKLGRRWIGIDITYLAINIIKKRFEKNGITDYQIIGEPQDLYSAMKLAQMDSFQFQIWCVTKLNGMPYERQSGDKGIDGYLNFIEAMTKKVYTGIIQVKGTDNIGPAVVRELRGTLDSNKAAFGILVSFKEKPTRAMEQEALRAGVIEIGNKKIRRIQFLYVGDMFCNRMPLDLPDGYIDPYRTVYIDKKVDQNRLL